MEIHQGQICLWRFQKTFLFLDFSNLRILFFYLINYSKPRSLMSSNITDNPLTDQGVALRTFQEKPLLNQNKSENSFLPSISFEQQSKKDPFSFVTTDTQVKILYLLLSYYPDELKATEIAKSIFAHRSTVSTNINELIEIGLVEKSIVKGTENHINPTLIFSISKDKKEQIEEFINIKRRLEPDLFLSANSLDATEDDSCDDSSDIDLSEVNSDKQNTQSISFEEEVGNMFIKVFEHMALMQQEIDELKMKLNEKPKPNSSFLQARSLAEAFSSNVKSKKIRGKSDEIK